MKKVAILYGWAEGSWESREFRGKLEAEGFAFIKSPKEADILIGHSLGCYLVPRGLESKKIILIGLPYWPNRGFLSSAFHKLRGELEFHRRNKSLVWWINKILHNGWYIVSRPSATFYAETRRKPQYLPNEKQNKVLLIRPSEDTFCHPRVMEILSTVKNYRYIELPGAHDDCWVNPQPYIDLLIKEL
jgi:hypothetical protein